MRTGNPSILILTCQVIQPHYLSHLTSALSPHFVSLRMNHFRNCISLNRIMRAQIALLVLYLVKNLNQTFIPEYSLVCFTKKQTYKEHNFSFIVALSN